MEKRGVILWIRYILLYKSINLTNGMTQSQKKKKEILSKKKSQKSNARNITNFSMCH